MTYRVKAKPLEETFISSQKEIKTQNKDHPGLTEHEENKEVTIIRQDIVDPKYIPVDMSKLLSQITVKVPLLEMMRIEEQKEKALGWVNGVTPTNTQSVSKADKLISFVNDSNENQCGEIISKIPQIYLDTNVVTTMSGIVDPFLLSLVINGKHLKNYMIDSRASNIVMPTEVMKSLGLKVDTPH